MKFKWFGISLMLISLISRTLHGRLDMRNFSSRNENSARDGEEEFRISALICNISYLMTLVYQLVVILARFDRLTKILFNSGTFSYWNDILYILDIYRWNLVVVHPLFVGELLRVGNRRLSFFHSWNPTYEAIINLIHKTYF